MTIKPELIESLRARREKIAKNVTPDQLKALHDKGKLSARERLDNLFDPGTFQEVGMHAEHHAVHFGMEGRFLPADGVVIEGSTVDAVLGSVTTDGNDSDAVVINALDGAADLHEIRIADIRHDQAQRVGAP